MHRKGGARCLLGAALEPCSLCLREAAHTASLPCSAACVVIAPPSRRPSASSYSASPHSLLRLPSSPHSSTSVPTPLRSGEKQTAQRDERASRATSAEQDPLRSAACILIDALVIPCCCDRPVFCERFDALCSAQLLSMSSNSISVGNVGNQRRATQQLAHVSFWCAPSLLQPLSQSHVR